MKELIQKYNMIRKEKSVGAADAYAQAEIKALNLDLANRIAAWTEIKAEAKAEAEQAARAAKKPAKAKTNNASINSTCKQVLEKLWTVTEKERIFLNDIKTKRKLTDKQAKWLMDLARRADVEIKGEISIKPACSRTPSADCRHEDLGSMGYVHGTIVPCPHCGQRTEVW